MVLGIEQAAPRCHVARNEKDRARLTANAKTDLDKAKALFYYVSQKIRYMGLTPEKDRPGFEPHDVCLTFGKKYGVCRDKAALLVAMLRTAGLNAYPVLVNVGSKKDAEVPDAGFNHAIVGVELKKGQYLLLDPTDEHARDFQPWYDGDQSYLVARPEGEDLRTSAFKPPEENMMRIKTTGVLTAAGRLEAKSELWFGGANDDIYRNAFSNMKAGRPSPVLRAIPQAGDAGRQAHVAEADAGKHAGCRDADQGGDGVFRGWHDRDRPREIGGHRAVDRERPRPRESHSRGHGPG